MRTLHSALSSPCTCRTPRPSSGTGTESASTDGTRSPQRTSKPPSSTHPSLRARTREGLAFRRCRRNPCCRTRSWFERISASLCVDNKTKGVAAVFDALRAGPYMPIPQSHMFDTNGNHKDGAVRVTQT
ncbi:hypothetical protein OF83DRAFT_1131089 [Amylostereum chailletii]|nr:hypothetical protein OF83DRAFT_1131089 [Amylostereum chailletii]